MHGRRRRRRGAAMVEFCLAIPLLAAISAATWFFGFAFKNQQKIRTSARYTAWAQLQDSFDPVDPQLNERFFNQAGRSIHWDGGPGPVVVLEGFAEGVGDYTAVGYDLAHVLVDQHAPRGRDMSVSAEFASNVGYWQRFQGAMRGFHSREGRAWRHRELGYSRLVREQYLDEVEEALRTVPAPGTDMADMIRHLYHGGW